MQARKRERQPRPLSDTVYFEALMQATRFSARQPVCCVAEAGSNGTAAKNTSIPERTSIFLIGSLPRDNTPLYRSVAEEKSPRQPAKHGEQNARYFHRRWRQSSAAAPPRS